ncbi:hypothetical protein [Tannockella kyphosi]|uniref:hypothetical protein n=1 Tax=Tannockella kyphosi TaxID=2899121 RepID=UPI0020131F26|nr:hypothetical protein [Tannockella kyphosi]
MRKLLTLLLAAILLVGCTSASEASYITSLPDGDGVVVSGEGVTITYDDIYYYLLESYGAGTVLEEALLYIAQCEITDEDAIQEAIDSLVVDYETYMSMTIDEYAVYLGYPDGDTYIEEVITSSAMNSLLTQKYIGENFDQLVEDYQVKYLKVVEVDTESSALTLISETTDVDAFDALVEEYEGSDYGIITNQSYIDENIVAKLDSFTADGLYSDAILTSTGTYALVYVYNTDLTDYVADVTDTLLYISDVVTLSEVHYLTTYEFSVYEGIIREEIEEYNTDYVG